MGRVMKPTQGRCEDCKHYTSDSPISGMCDAIDDSVLRYWTGCIRWKPKESNNKETRRDC